MYISSHLSLSLSLSLSLFTLISSRSASIAMYRVLMKHPYDIFIAI